MKDLTFIVAVIIVCAAICFAVYYDYAKDIGMAQSGFCKKPAVGTSYLIWQPCRQ